MPRTCSPSAPFEAYECELRPWWSRQTFASPLPTERKNRFKLSTGRRAGQSQRRLGPYLLEPEVERTLFPMANVTG